METYHHLERFLDLLAEENQRLNLTAIRDPEEAWPLHICDSLAAWAILDGLGPKSVADLGTGGGLPGLPLACVAPEVQFTLIDATRKKADAVRRMASALGLENVEVVWGRAEELGRNADFRERYDGLVARAVGKLPLLVEQAAGLLRVGGSGVFYKSVHAAEDEARTATSAATACGMDLADIVSYALPGGHGERAFVVYAKEAALRRNLPRPASVAKGKPL